MASSHTQAFMWSQPVISSIESGREYSYAESESLRAAYEEMIMQSNWKEVLLEVAQNIKHGLEKSSEYNPALPDNCEYQIKIGGQLYELNQSVITIGRKIGCDIHPANSNLTTSRLHVVIFILDQHVIVVDPGSFLGVITKERSNTSKEKKHSLPNARQPLVFDRDEAFVLTLGDKDVVFSPKMCLICAVNPREYLATCGHYTVCRECQAEQGRRGDDKCPICRQNDPNGRVTFQAIIHTNAN